MPIKTEGHLGTCGNPLINDDLNAAVGDQVDLLAIAANIGEPDDQVFAFTQNPAGYSAWSSRDWLYADTDSDARLNFIARITSVKSLTAKALLL